MLEPGGHVEICLAHAFVAGDLGVGGDEGVGGVVDTEDVDEGALQGGHAAVVAAPDLEARVATGRRRLAVVAAAEPERVVEGEVPACRRSQSALAWSWRRRSEETRSGRSSKVGIMLTE
jgi:hypothetical protein